VKGRANYALCGCTLSRGGDVGVATRVGPKVQSVLGLSITSTSVGWVLLDGEGPDAVTLDHDAFDVQSDAGVGDKPQHTAAARGAQAIATASGHQVGSLRVTWSEDVEADATALLKSLADLGFENVHAISLSEATRSWAIEVGRANEHAKTALCILEPGTATVMVVATGAGSVRTAVTNTRAHTVDLVDWLTTTFNRDGWLPECLHLVGSHDDLDAVKGPIGDTLPIPVIASVDSQLALARGAALATVWPVAVISPPVAEAARTETPRPDRSKLVKDAKKVAVSAAAFAVVAGVLSLAAGSALNVGEVSMEAANSPAVDTSATSSVRPVAAPTLAPPAAPVQAMVAQPPPPPAAQPAPPETLTPPDEPVAAVRPERDDAPVYQQTVPAAPLANVSAAAPTAAAPARVAAPLAVPPAVPPAAPLAVPPAAPLAVPPAAPLGAPIAAPPVPADPPEPPPPPDPLQIVMSPLLGGLP